MTKLDALELLDSWRKWVEDAESWMSQDRTHRAAGVHLTNFLMDCRGAIDAGYPVGRVVFDVLSKAEKEFNNDDR